MVLERRDKKLTDDYLAQLICDNPIDRNEDLHSFISLLDEVEDGFSFFLDGKWGSGKTVFVKQAILVLKSLHGIYKDTLDLGIIENIGKGLSDLEPARSYLPIYYNAWENDVFTDSTVTLLGTLIAESGYDSFGKYSSEVADKLTALADAILKPFKLDSFTGMKEGFSASDLLTSMKETQAVQSNFKELVSTILYERADKLVLFIDELDRCSPAFALQLIERVKFVLTIENVVVVFSTDISQLVHTIEGYYGHGFNGNRYLTRYYDLKLTLKTIRPSDFLVKQGSCNTGNYSDRITQEMANYYGFTLRDCLRYVQDIDSIREIALAGFTDMAANLLTRGLVPVILAIKTVNSGLFQKVLAGTAEEDLLALAKNSPSFERYLENCFQQENSHLQEDEQRFETSDDFFRAVYSESFGGLTSAQNVAEIPKVFTWEVATSLVDALFGIKGINSSQQ